ncbi:ferritin [Marinitoga lauensis]|uniref:ferritin n=1 Tax=Marinitoga lauensis TaxID=2201189 RepID=UPI001011DC1A|nr:ferritin [Marinitoga lauensis]
MISKTMENALNKQINEELFSAYLYLSMAAYFEEIGLKGFSNWMRVQYEEETFHAMKIYDYLLSRGGKVVLQAIKEPQKNWESPLDVFKATLKHEQHITKCINDLIDIAEKEHDRATFNFLQWYIDEQVEEEANDEEIIRKLELIKDNPNALFMLDRELASRVFNKPTLK